jgi:tripartite-type tricarboxylate transporter receptor subunit TctC
MRLFTLAMMVLAPAIALGQYPAKPVRIVVPYTTGGAPDILARLLGEELSKSMGANFIVDNRPGQGGSIGADAVAKAPADGYTLLMTTTATQSINQFLYAKLPYDPAKDFSGVALVAHTPVVLVVAPSVSARNLKDLVQQAKAQPGQLSFASAGPGTLQHIAAELMKSMAGVDMVHVPYKGTGQLTPDLLAGRVSLMFNSVAAFAALVKEGKLLALAVTRKTAALPGVPTFEEAGLPGFDVSPWYGIFVPAGTPRDVVARLNGELLRAAARPNVQQRYEALGLEPGGGTPESLDAMVRADAQKWGKVIRDNRIQAE